MNYLRIKTNKHFQRLFKRGKRVFSPSLTLLVIPSDKMQFGIALSKKYGKAVRRNRIKRLLRASFMQTQGSLKGHYEIIALPKIADEYSFAVFQRDFLTCFKKMNG